MYNTGFFFFEEHTFILASNILKDWEKSFEVYETTGSLLRHAVHGGCMFLDDTWWVVQISWPLFWPILFAAISASDSQCSPFSSRAFCWWDICIAIVSCTSGLNAASYEVLFFAVKFFRTFICVILFHSTFFLFFCFSCNISLIFLYTWPHSQALFPRLLFKFQLPVFLSKLLFLLLFYYFVHFFLLSFLFLTLLCHMLMRYLLFSSHVFLFASFLSASSCKSRRTLCTSFKFKSCSVLYSCWICFTFCWRAFCKRVLISCFVFCFFSLSFSFSSLALCCHLPQGELPLPSATGPPAFVLWCWWRRHPIPGVCSALALSDSSPLGLLTFPWLIGLPLEVLECLFFHQFLPLQFLSKFCLCFLFLTHFLMNASSSTRSSSQHSLNCCLAFQSQNFVSIFLSSLLIIWFSLSFFLLSLTALFFQLHFSKILIFFRC